MAGKFNNFIDSFPSRAESYFEKTKVNQWINNDWKDTSVYKTLSDIGEKTGFNKGANAIIATMNAITVAHMNNADPVFNFLMNASPEELCDFNLRNQSFRMRLMQMNFDNRELTLSHIGGSISNNGDSQSISHEVMAPSYTTGNNYVEDYARSITPNQNSGMEATRNVTIGKDHTNPYQVNTNLYPDQDGTGTFDNKWKLTGNKNSLLYKTKNLFLNKQINTIVDRFHTDPQSPDHPLNTKTQYGMSHGNNVLTRKAEYSNISYPKNGYDNPYCRVWTHHHQYDEYTKVIRPFVNEEGQPVTVKQFHEWGKDWEYDNEKKAYKGYYKSKDNTGWNYSVIGANGLPNITPKYISGGSSNIHTKQCMFSIENLAWRDYDPYSFETALSWEQRGPMGGRIMWFPPYGIQFNETVNTNWSANQFIGRGEDIYTYTNTMRSGSLRFMLVVDHPSIVDYVGWNEANHDVVRTTDWRRFFAGCDTVDPDDDGGYGGGGATGPNGSGGKNYGPGFSIVSKAKPTPLTDEYIQYSDELDPNSLLKKPSNDEKQVDEPKTVTFYVFYPNNYSGAYDRVKNKSVNSKEFKDDKLVQAIPYLLYGLGAQMNGDNEMPITFDDTKYSQYWGDGYEMKKDGIGQVNYIKRSAYVWSECTENSVFVESNETNDKNYDRLGNKWWYRIDYEYKNEYKGSPNFYVNTCDQILPQRESYTDRNTFGLNSNVSKVAELFADEEGDKINPEDENKLPENDNGEYLVSLAEIAYLLCNNEDIKQRIQDNSFKTIDLSTNERLQRVKEVLENKDYNISVSAFGYSNSHDDNVLAKERNKKLAQNRAITVLDWIRSIKGDSWQIIDIDESSETQYDEEHKNSGFKSSVPVPSGVNNEKAKQYRSAKVIISFSETKQENASSSNQEANAGPLDMKSVINEVSNKIGFEHVCDDNIVVSKSYIQIEPKDTKDLSEIVNKYKKAISDFILDYKEAVPNTRGEIYDRLIKMFEILFEQKKDDILHEEYQDSVYLCNGFYNLHNIFKDWVKDANAIEFEKKVNEIVDKKGAEYQEFKYTELLAELANNYKDNYFDKVDSCYEFKESDFKDGKYVGSDDSGIIKRFNSDIKKVIDNYNFDKLKYPKDLTKKIKNKTLDDVLVVFDRLYMESSTGGASICFDVTYETNSGWVYLCPKNYFDLYKQEYDKDFEKEINEKINKENENRYSHFKVEELMDWASTTLDKVYDELLKVRNVDDRVLAQVTTAIGDAYDVIFDIVEFDDESLLVEYMKDFNIPDKAEGYVKEYLNTYFDTYWSKNGFEAKQDSTIYFNYHFLNVFDDYDDEIYDNEDYKIDGITDKEFEKQFNEHIEAYDNSEYIGFSKHVDPNTKETYYINENETDPAKKAKQWVEVRDPESGEVTKIVWKDATVARYDVTNQDPNIGKEFEETHNRASKNYYRYDQEYHFFKVLEQKSKFTYDKLMDKIKYFDPAFHSMTPEGFNARLTFLNQCMRQGNTVAATDLDNPNRSASNLAFGRPPYCVLRLGDFYNQLIVIDNISIDYDPLQWDLNTEGIGMQPLLANVNISFKFIGGGDMAGPVRRLQNAMSFNYYANASLYDNRADRMSYKFDDKTNGALDHGMKMDETYFHNVENYQKKY